MSCRSNTISEANMTGCRIQVAKREKTEDHGRVRATLYVTDRNTKVFLPLGEGASMDANV